MLDFSDRTRIGISILTSSADEQWDFSGIQIVKEAKLNIFQFSVPPTPLLIYRNYRL